MRVIPTDATMTNTLILTRLACASAASLVADAMVHMISSLSKTIGDGAQNPSAHLCTNVNLTAAVAGIYLVKQGTEGLPAHSAKQAII